MMLEQRKNKRFKVPEGTRALACGKIGQVVDISKGGLSLMVLDGSITNIEGELSLDLLCNEKHIDTRQIPGKIVWDKEVSFSAISGMVYKKIGIQLGNLSPSQRKMFNALLLNYTGKT